MSIIGEIREEIRGCIEQIEAIQLKVIKLKEDNKKWIAAVSLGGNGRIILHLSALTKSSRESLQFALNNNYPWISFDNGGNTGVTSTREDGLEFYADTKVVFPLEVTK